ncbi:MAG TPA: alkaline phosphatase PhoX, partial [Aestuariivirgaceae bacterium]|nr:alkaline phosphatase PhoX [Aestuariivirgaceae bacterium]
MREDRSSHSGSPSFPEVLEARLTRRDILKTAAATGATIALGAGFVGSVFESKAVAKGSISSLEFTELQRVYDQTHHIAPGYRADVLIRWGDKLFADAPDFDASKQSVESQSRQFGYDNDYIGYLPLPKGSNSSDHGLLCVNNEYPNPHVMFPGLVVSDPDAGKKMSKEQVDVCLASMGLSIVEVRKTDGKWAPVENSPYNRRITGFTEMAISGPAAGHALMKTKSDP